MKTQTKMTDTWKFAELDEATKQKVLEHLWDINVDGRWWEYIYSDAADIGLTITSFDLGRGRDIEGRFTHSCEDVANNIIKNHGSTCNTYKTAAEFLAEYMPIATRYEKADRIAYNYRHHEGVYNLVYKLQGIMEDIQEEFLNDILDDYLAMLDQEYDYLTSEAAIIGTIEANDYDFTAEGRIY